MEKILLVDDEEHILKDLGDALKEKGYEIVTASKIDEAKLKVNYEEINYAIIDLTMDFTSEYGGIQLIKFIKQKQLNIKIIILSAYSFEYVKEELKRQLLEYDKSKEVLKEIEKNYICKGSEDNYIDAVLKKLEEMRQTEHIKTCFVIMPFSTTTSCTKEEWTDIFENFIKPSVEDDLSYSCVRANIPAGGIIEHILDNLYKNSLVIADLTDKNPNVLYELGVRHSLQEHTILITQNMDDVPFDLKPYRVIGYCVKHFKGKEEFKKNIKEAINFLKNNPNHCTSPVKKYLNQL